MKLKFFGLALSLCSAAFAVTSKPDNSAFYPGDPLTDNRYPPAYNAPAQIATHNVCNSFRDFKIDASFIYWVAEQDGMALAFSRDLSGTSVNQNQKSVFLFQPFNYQPGFKVGLGVGMDEWDLHAEYTWIRNRSSVSSNAPTNHTITGTPVWAVAETWWFGGEFLPATHISSTWNLGIDWIDLTAGRPFYQGTNVTISPLGGLRAMWIRQTLNIKATVPSSFAEARSGTLAHDPVVSRTQSHSWGIGPMVGATGSCLLGAGFRVEADAGMSILFTQYTSLTQSQDAVLTDHPPSVAKSAITDYDCLRTATNLGLGLGWAEYFCKGSYYMDFSATYDFNVLWTQNMLQNMGLESLGGISVSNDLFLHGLTISGSFHF